MITVRAHGDREREKERWGAGGCEVAASHEYVMKSYIKIKAVGWGWGGVHSSSVCILHHSSAFHSPPRACSSPSLKYLSAPE